MAVNSAATWLTASNLTQRAKNALEQQILHQQYKGMTPSSVSHPPNVDSQLTTRLRCRLWPAECDCLGFQGESITANCSSRCVLHQQRCWWLNLPNTHRGLDMIPAVQTRPNQPTLKKDTKANHQQQPQSSQAQENITFQVIDSNHGNAVAAFLAY